MSQTGSGHPGDGFLFGVRVGGGGPKGNSPPPTSASSCRNPNRKTVSPAVSCCISRKPWGIICICQKTLSLQLFHPEFLQALPLAAGARGSPGEGWGWRGRGGHGRGPGRDAAPGAPGAPGDVTDQTPRENSLSHVGFEWQGEPFSGAEGSGMGQGSPWKPSRPASAGQRCAGVEGALRARGRRWLGRRGERRGLRIQKGLISFCSTS